MDHQYHSDDRQLNHDLQLVGSVICVLKIVTHLVVSSIVIFAWYRRLGKRIRKYPSNTHITWDCLHLILGVYQVDSNDSQEDTRSKAKKNGSLLLASYCRWDLLLEELKLQ
jgi:hypothetical protein